MFRQVSLRPPPCSLEPEGNVWLRKWGKRLTCLSAWFSLKSASGFQLKQQTTSESWETAAAPLSQKAEQSSAAFWEEAFRKFKDLTPNAIITQSPLSRLLSSSPHIEMDGTPSLHRARWGGPPPLGSRMSQPWETCVFWRITSFSSSVGRSERCTGCRLDRSPPVRHSFWRIFLFLSWNWP